MTTSTYTFTTGLDYAAILAAAARVDWTVDGVFRGRSFDTSEPLVPGSWVGTWALGFLDEYEQLVLNHCRAFSYVHVLGNFEDFVAPHLGDTAAHLGHDDPRRSRALARFGEEEVKHQELFRRAETVLERSCGLPFGRYFDADGRRVRALNTAILEHSLLARFLIVLAFEWGTQRHYVESIRDRTGALSDALYVDVLRAHWAEEAQHTKWDTLAIADLARESSPEELSAAFDDLREIGRLFDKPFAGQASEEVDTVERVTGRRFSESERTTLTAVLQESLGTILGGVGLSHPSFAKVARELSAEGAAKLGIA
jgi:hypothetical protein